MSDSNKIYFSKLKQPYGEFSNFYPSSMSIGSKDYETVEHYYQSKKFEGTKYEEIIRTQRSPMKAKQVAYSEEAKKYFINRWDDETKLLVMGKALRVKFNIPRFKNILLSSGTSEIIEYSNRDYFWGRGDDGAGANMLGKLLMELREQIKSQENKQFF